MDPSPYTYYTTTEEIKPTRLVEDPSDPTGKSKLSLWYHDGSIVLLAENHVFKAYEGILADKSPVFKDMLSMPPPAEPEEYEGCKMVRLPDKALDVYYFLKALHDYEAFFQSTMMQKFPAMSALLRLGTKYEVQGLRQRAISLLLTCYPMSIEDHFTRRFVEYDCEAFRLAVDLGLTYVLPSVYYECSARLLLSELSRTPHLTAEEKDLCFEFRETCGTQLAAMHCDLLTLEPCINQCNQKAIAAARDIMCPESMLPDPLSHSNEDEDPSWETFTEIACQGCINRAKLGMEESRREFWAQMPGILKLPDWDMLMAQKARDLGED